MMGRTRLRKLDIFLFLFVLFALFGLTAISLRAQESEVVLQATQTSRILIACPPVHQKTPIEGGLDSMVHEVLRSDLQASGAIQVVEEPSAQLLLKTTLEHNWLGKLVLQANLTDPKTRKGAFHKSYTGEAKQQALLVRRMVHRMVDDLVFTLTGNRSAADSRIVFARELRAGVKEIFQIDADGASPLQLTHHGSLTISPTVAADGRLAYLTYRSGHPEIWGQRKPGAAHQRLYPLDGYRHGTLTCPTWSPDGKRLAFAQSNHRGDMDLFVLDIDPGRVRQLTANAGINTEPTWDPAGNRIAFTSDRLGSPQVFLMESDGSNVQRLTQEGRYNATPAWSPLGDMIAYVSRFEGSFDLFVHKLGERKAYQVTRGIGSSESPQWSPDGRWIVFSNNQAGTRQLWVTDSSGDQQRRLAALPDCQSPRWIRSR